MGKDPAQSTKLSGWSEREGTWRLSRCILMPQLRHGDHLLVRTARTPLSRFHMIPPARSLRGGPPVRMPHVQSIAGRLRS
jgi:hypothetical protein